MNTRDVAILIMFSWLISFLNTRLNEICRLSLFELFETSVISYSEALRYADSVNDLRLLIKTESNRAKSSDFNEGTEKLHLL